MVKVPAVRKPKQKLKTLKYKELTLVACLLSFHLILEPSMELIKLEHCFSYLSICIFFEMFFVNVFFKMLFQKKFYLDFSCGFHLLDIMKKCILFVYFLDREKDSRSDLPRTVCTVPLRIILSFFKCLPDP